MTEKYHVKKYKSVFERENISWFVCFRNLPATERLLCYLVLISFLKSGINFESLWFCYNKYNIIKKLGLVFKFQTNHVINSLNEITFCSFKMCCSKIIYLQIIFQNYSNFIAFQNYSDSIFCKIFAISGHFSKIFEFVQMLNITAHLLFSISISFFYQLYKLSFLISDKKYTVTRQQSHWFNH